MSVKFETRIADMVSLFLNSPVALTVARYLDSVASMMIFPEYLSKCPPINNKYKYNNGIQIFEGDIVYYKKRYYIVESGTDHGIKIKNLYNDKIKIKSSSQLTFIQQNPIHPTIAWSTAILTHAMRQFYLIDLITISEITKILQNEISYLWPELPNNRSLHFSVNHIENLVDGVPKLLLKIQSDAMDKCRLFDLIPK